MGKISLCRHTDIYVLPSRILNVQKYRDDIRFSIVHPFPGAVVDTFILKADNAHRHAARLVRQCLEAESIVQMK